MSEPNWTQQNQLDQLKADHQQALAAKEEKIAELNSEREELMKYGNVRRVCEQRVEIQALQARVAELRLTLAQLIAENQALRSQLAAALALLAEIDAAGEVPAELEKYEPRS